MVCSGDKTKLLIVGTSANRARKLESHNYSIEVKIGGVNTLETKSERLLGIVVNNTGTWKNHIYGDEENDGLIPQLNKRIGVLKRLRKYMSDSKFRIMVHGIFISKLTYGISVWGGVWGLQSYDEENRKCVAISKEDMRKLQVLQNTVMRLMTGLDVRTSTADLCNRSNLLSVHQLVAYHSVNQVYKIYHTQRPAYHYDRLFSVDRRRNNAMRIDFNLSLGRTSFFYYASRLWNNLPVELRMCASYDAFKFGSRMWIRDNIQVRPS